MSKKSDDTWVPLADLMSALMLVFLLIIVLFLIILPVKSFSENLEVQKFERVNVLIYQDLQETFSKYNEQWGIEIGKDLSIKFNNPNIIFERDSTDIKNSFKFILNEFTPLYIGIINKQEYINNIKEIKIEGHTGLPSQKFDTYIETVKLSQDRARAILEYILLNASFQNLPITQKQKIEFWLSANGFGYSRALNSNNRFVYGKAGEGGNVSPISRRVEFRIITDTESLIKEFKESNIINTVN